MNYARTSRFYWWLETLSFGSWLKRARVCQLHRIEKVEYALLLGEGNGSFLLPLVRRFPDARITVIDESQEMLDCARARLLGAGLAIDRIEFIYVNVLNYQWPVARFDLVVSHFFFDNFLQADVDRMIQSLASSTRPGAQWLMADFHIPASGWRRARARIWMWVIYCFFGQVASVPTRGLPDVESALAAAGYERSYCERMCGELLMSALYRNSRRVG